MDLLSRKVADWAMSEQMNSTLVERALQMALQTRQPESSLLHQSDQGSQQTSDVPEQSGRHVHPNQYEPSGQLLRQRGR